MMALVSLDGPGYSSALSSSGFVYLLIYRQSGGMRLECRDLNGGLVWKRRVKAAVRDPYHTIRLHDDGTIWVLQDNHITAFSASGRVTTEVLLPAAPEEQCGSFVLDRESLIVSLFSDAPGHPNPGKVARVTMNGSPLWSTEISIEDISHEGVVEMRAETGFRQEQKPGWRPRRWESAYSEPLIVSGSCILASFRDDRTGIGRSYCLDRANGKLLWATVPAPSSSKAIAGENEFLIGEQGYGAFSTSLYDGNGNVLRRWKSHGYYIIDTTGDIRLIEMQNTLPSQMRVARLPRDGNAVRGRRLDGYRTAYPVLAGDGKMVFWRKEENCLFSVDAELNVSVLHACPMPNDLQFFGRMLLADDGTLLFTSNSWQGQNFLCILKTDLPPVPRGVWACGNGNLTNNPVFDFP
jgi:hypothetical protein